MGRGGGGMREGVNILHVAVICIIILAHTDTVAYSNTLVIQDTRCFFRQKPIAAMYFTMIRNTISPSSPEIERQIKLYSYKLIDTTYLPMMSKLFLITQDLWIMMRY